MFLRKIMDPLVTKRPIMMPAHFGSRPTEKATGWYHDVTCLTIPYRTDPEKLAKYVPSPFRLQHGGILIVQYAMNRQIDWLAGRSYNIVQVMTPVIFEGKVDQLEGYFSLVLWENLCDPILTGREFQGMPKLFATIPDHTVNEGQWSVSASHFDHEIVRMTAQDFQEQSADAMEADARSRAGKDHWFGWRFVPEIGGGEGLISHPTLFPLQQVIKQSWIGTGKVNWQTLTWEQNPTQSHIVNALAALPVLEAHPAQVTQGSTNLYLPTNLPRAIQ